MFSKMASSYLYYVIFLALPMALAARCQPDLCPFYRCCRSDNTCAMSFSECGVCDPDRCASGCCDGKSCSLTSDSCSLSPGIIMIVTVTIGIMLGVCAVLVGFRLAKRVITRRNRAVVFGFGDGQLQIVCNRVSPPVPIIEVEAPKLQAIPGIPINCQPENIVEINHADFLRQQQKDKEICLKNGLMCQKLKLSQGIKPSPEDNIKKNNP